jgi:hypothetical protein
MEAVVTYRSNWWGFIFKTPFGSGYSVFCYFNIDLPSNPTSIR